MTTPASEYRSAVAYWLEYIQKLANGEGLSPFTTAEYGTVDDLEIMTMGALEEAHAYYVLEGPYDWEVEGL